MLEILGVEKGGIARELGIESGDKLVTINSHPVNDCIDFAYYRAGRPDCEGLNITVQKVDGTILEIEADIDDDELGLELPPIEAKSCRNKCIFCFVHQLPKGLRKSLYVKDEDYRLSFLMGNYVTLAKISESDIDRIREQRLSPLYISVHSTNPQVRERLLGVRPDHEIMALMGELASAGINMHTQIVVCPGINDGDVLKRSIEDIFTLYPRVISLSVVPVGLTSHRNKLHGLVPVDEKNALDTIGVVERLQGNFRKRCGTSFVFLADEYYLKAGIGVPDYDHYEDFPQIENGVGLLASFLRDSEALLNSSSDAAGRMRGSVISGTSPQAYVRDFIDKFNRRFGSELEYLPLGNRLFGDSVTVTGLLSAGDIIAQLRGRELGGLLLIPDIVLRDGEGSFLDDLTVDDVERELGVKVVTFDSTPRGFMEVLSANY